MLPPLLPGQVIRIGPAAGTGTPTGITASARPTCASSWSSRAASCRCAATASPARGWVSAAGISPIALHVETDSLDDPAGVRYDGVTGVDNPLLADPTPPGASQLPAGVVEINRENYMLVTTTKDLRPADVAVGESRSRRRATGRRCRDRSGDAGYAGGRQSQISGYYDPIPTAGLAERLGLHRGQQLRPQRTGGAVPGDAGDLHRPGDWQGWSVGRRLGTSRRRRCGTTGWGR